MTTLRKVLRIIILAILPIFITLGLVFMTLQVTLLNPSMLKGWAKDGGLYDNLMGTFLNAEELADGQSLIDVPTLQKAIDKTATPAYLEEKGGAIIDSFASWLSGKDSELMISIDLSDKRADFEANLAAELQPQFATFPVCPPLADYWETRCVPPTETAESYAKFVASEAADDTSFFEKPLTAEDLDISSSDRWPAMVQAVTTAAWTLTIGMVVLSGLYILLAVERRESLKAIGRTWAINGGIILVGGIILWLSGAALAAALVEAIGEEDITALVGPIFNTAIPSIGMWLAILSGITVAVGIVLWVLPRFIKHDEGSAPATPIAPTTTPTTPPASTSNGPTTGSSGNLL